MYEKLPTVLVSIVAGDQVPEIGGVFVELNDNVGAVPSLQIFATGLTVVKIGSSIVTLIVTWLAQKLESGVKVYGNVPETLVSTIVGDQVPVIGAVLVD